VNDPAGASAQRHTPDSIEELELPPDSSFGERLAGVVLVMSALAIVLLHAYGT